MQDKKHWETLLCCILQMLEMANVLAQDSEVLDWRLFLLSAALPWPLASKQQLLQLLTSYQAADPQATGYITQEQFMQVQLIKYSYCEILEL